jgi:hypothetical protein
VHEPDTDFVVLTAEQTVSGGTPKLTQASWDLFTALPARARITIDKHAKDPTPGKPSKSYVRFKMYRDATTKGELGTLSGQRRDDIKWDLAHGTIKVARQDIPASASPVAGMLPDGVHPDRAHLWDSLELVDKEATRRLGLALERNAEIGGCRAEQGLFTAFVREEDKEDGAHTPDPAGGAALHASLADEALNALKD